MLAIILALNFVKSFFDVYQELSEDNAARRKGQIGKENNL